MLTSAGLNPDWFLKLFVSDFIQRSSVQCLGFFLGSPEFSYLFLDGLIESQKDMLTFLLMLDPVGSRQERSS